MADLHELRERVRAAEGPDENLDLIIMRRIFNDDHKAIDEWVEIGEVTASIDAALSLVERVLPDHKDGAQFLWSLAYDEDGVAGPRSYCCGLSYGYHWPETIYGHSDVSAPLAILSALLTALIEQAEKQDAAE